LKFIFDSNVYFAILHDPEFLDRHRAALARAAPRTVLSSVVRAELLQGARGDLGRARVTRATRTLERAGRVVAPTHEDWVIAGIIQGRIWDDHPALRSKRLLHDILIVCGLRRVGAALITTNVRDFTRIARYLPHVRMAIEDLEP
jgi:predicted nucleic acid-binding protein